MMLRYPAASNSLKRARDPCVARDQPKLRGAVTRQECRHFCNWDAEAGKEWRKYSPPCSVSCPLIFCNVSYWLNEPKATWEMEPTGYNLCKSGRWACNVCEWANTLTICRHKCSSLSRAVANAHIYRGQTGAPMRRRNNMSLKVMNATPVISFQPWGHTDIGFVQGPFLEVKHKIQIIL